MKHLVTNGGRVRPYVRFLQQIECDHLVDDLDHRPEKQNSIHPISPLADPASLPR
ncbi:hypothetical protein [Sphingobium olei]|uniref:hypothetical protein n=1 Tax=Sphingobium olei TaxID=420955 RepID=UPI003D24882F